MSMNRNQFLLLSVAAAFALGACAPKLIVRHEDPTHLVAQLSVDGQSTGFLENGRTLTMRVRRGYHTVNAVPRGGDGTNPWSDDGEAWTFYVDRKAEITLLPVQ